MSLSVTKELNKMTLKYFKEFWTQEKYQWGIQFDRVQTDGL